MNVKEKLVLLLLVGVVGLCLFCPTPRVESADVKPEKFDSMFWVGFDTGFACTLTAFRLYPDAGYEELKAKTRALHQMGPEETARLFLSKGITNAVLLELARSTNSSRK